MYVTPDLGLVQGTLSLLDAESFNTGRKLTKVSLDLGVLISKSKDSKLQPTRATFEDAFPQLLTGLSEKFRYYPEQAFAISRILADSTNKFLLNDTGGGKTAIALACAQNVIASGGRVLFLSRKRHLVNQICKDALDYTNLTSAEIANLNGMTPEKRSKAYADSKHKLFLTTAETGRNDLASKVNQGRVDPLSFDLIIFDEAHTMDQGERKNRKGQDAYNLIFANSRKLPQVLLMSASILDLSAEKKSAEDLIFGIQTFLKRAQIAEVIKIELPGVPVVSKNIFCPLKEAFEILVSKLDRQIDYYTERLAKDYQEKILLAIQGLSPSQRFQFEDLDSEQEYFQKITKTCPPYFQRGRHASFLSSLNELDSKRDFPVSLFDTYLRYQTYNEAIRLREYLTSYGGYAYLQYMGSLIWDQRSEQKFGAHRWNLVSRLCFDEEHSAFREVFDQLAQGTPFQTLLTKDDLSCLDPELKYNRESKSRFVVMAREAYLATGNNQILNRGYFDHPKIGKLLETVQDYFELPEQGKKMLVCTDLVEHVFFLKQLLVERLALSSSAVTTAVGSGQHSTKLGKDSLANILAFQDPAGPSILVATVPLIALGTDVKGARGILSFRPQDKPVTVQQLEGRVRRQLDFNKMSPNDYGYFYTLYSRFDSAKVKILEARQRLQKEILAALSL